jgi:hypothetical protein
LLLISFLSYQTTSILIIPDVVSAIVLTWYFIILTGSKFTEKPVPRGIIIGILGGLAYYARHYNLLFVIAHLMTTAFISIIKGHSRKSTLITTVTGIIATILVVAPWITALSLRYGQFTLSTGWSINRSVIGPEGVKDEYRPCSGGSPCKTLDDVLFPWEDPPLEYFPASDWNPFSDRDSFLLQHQIISEGISKWFHFLISSYGTFPLIGLVISLFLTFIFWTDSRRQYIYPWTMITSILYATGYISFGGGESRYHLPYIPLLLMSAYWLADFILLKIKTISSISKLTNLTISVLILGLPVISLMNVPKLLDGLRPTDSDSCRTQDVSLYVEKVIPPMVGSGKSINYLALQTGIQTYGSLPPEITPDEADRILHEISASTFIALSGSDLERDLIEEYGYQLVGVDDSCEVRYSILRVPLN